MPIKNIVLAVLLTFCITAVLFTIIPVNSTGTYNPWLDVNDDGKINILDLIKIATNLGTSGTPLNMTQVILDLQNRVKTLEEQQNYIKTIRLYTPNETTTNDTAWKDAAIFTWNPQNATNNAIIQDAFYFQYLTSPTNYQLVWRTLINGFEVVQNSVVNITTKYQSTTIMGFGAWDYPPIKPNQSSYTIKFQIRCAANYTNPIYAKGINILLEVMDGLPPS